VVLATNMDGFSLWRTAQHEIQYLGETWKLIFQLRQNP